MVLRQIQIDKVSAVVNMESPQNVSELRRFLGMVNQLGKFVPNLATVTEPLRVLLSTRSSWYWDQPQVHAFNEIKQMLSSSPVLSLYDPCLKTKVTADSSSYGLGAVLTQQQPDGRWAPVAFASRSLIPTERRYAQIEKEALTLTWACTRFQDYLIGITFTLETDHKPLISLLGTAKSLDQLPPRIQRMKMRLMRFAYTIIHVPGKELYTADTLSRAPVDVSKVDVIEDLTEEIEVFVNVVMQGFPATDNRIEEIRQHQFEDETCQELSKYAREGWPEKENLKGMVRHYWPYRAQITFVNNLLLYESRIVIPSALRQDVLEKLHEGHQGILKCRRRAIQSVWWPGISKNVKELIENCQVCCETTKNHPEPLIPTPMPARPWQRIAADLIEFKKVQYLVVVDYYSRYIELSKLENTSSASIINHLKSIMARHGVPEALVSDNGPQFSSKEFVLFAKDYGFSHVTSSPGHASGNGEVERAVRTVKELLYAAQYPYSALLNYRSTPLANGYSPAELQMSRKIRTKLPELPRNLEPVLPKQQRLQVKEETSRVNMKLNFDKHHAAKSLPVLRNGDEVWLHERKESGRVQGQSSSNTGRSYVVKTPTTTVRRNKVQLNKLRSKDASKSNPPESNKHPVSQPLPVIGVPKPPEQSTEKPVQTRSGRVV